MFQQLHLFNLIIFNLICSLLTGCLYGDVVPINGQLEITLNKHNNLCFAPLFKTLNEEYDNIPDYIFFNKLIIRDNKWKAGDSYIAIITPKNGNESFRINNKQKICIDENNSRLEQKIYTSINGDELLVLMSGSDGNHKTIYNFIQVFAY